MLLYIPYTILIVLGLILLVGGILLAKRRRAALAALLVAIPLLVLTQVYFWNAEFNHLAKSYLFPSRAFTCEHEEEWKGLSIALPPRTVFLAKEDGCSPFYLTYTDGDAFKAFYQKELETLAGRGFIRQYRNVEREEPDGNDTNAYVVELPSGSRIEISYKIEAGDRFVSIDYQRPR